MIRDYIKEESISDEEEYQHLKCLDGLYGVMSADEWKDKRLAELKRSGGVWSE